MLSGPPWKVRDESCLILNQTKLGRWPTIKVFAALLRLLFGPQLSWFSFLWLCPVFQISTAPLPMQENKIDKQLQQLLRCIYVKWICNCISTGAHILKGKVFRNIMVDVRVSNRKLYQRAVSIIQVFQLDDNKIVAAYWLFAWCSCS